MMAWLWERRYIDSTKNGSLVVQKSMGQLTVSHADAQLTGDRVNQVLREGLQTLHHAITNNPRVLLLGLGAGGILQDIYILFPNASITAVEHDPLMIALAKEMKLYASYPPPKIIEDDAGVVVSHLTHIFDLIIIDLFYGLDPSPLLVDAEFLKKLSERLAPQGKIVVNAFIRKDYLETMKRSFEHARIWQCKQFPNYLGVFWN